MKIPVTAVIVSLNEGSLLEKALPNLQFCERIIVVDIGSTDNTREVAARFDVELWTHERVPVVEIVHNWIQDKIDTEWMLITDPDEMITEGLRKSILKEFSNLPSDIGAVRVPCFFYFGKRKLKGGPWGGLLSRVLMVNLNGYYFTTDVHRGRRIKPGWRELTLDYDGSNELSHYWMQNLRQLVQKHRRYLSKEGKARYDSGMRIGMRGLLTTPISQMKYALLKRKGYLDGLTGVFLCFFWTWYQFVANYELWKHERSINRSNECI